MRRRQEAHRSRLMRFVPQRILFKADTQTTRRVQSMNDNVEHLILEQFRALRNQIEGLQTEMRNEFGDVKHRINRLESAVAGIRRDEAGTAEDIARQQSTLDQLKERIDRIERRLELTSLGPT
jgi:chromosome segregation ATPase